jgi:hypothetical protein
MQLPITVRDLSCGKKQVVTERWILRQSPCMSHCFGKMTRIHIAKMRKHSVVHVNGAVTRANL